MERSLPVTPETIGAKLTVPLVIIRQIPKYLDMALSLLRPARNPWPAVLDDGLGVSMGCDSDNQRPNSCTVRLVVDAMQTWL